MLVNSAKLSDEYISAGEHVGVKCVVTDSYNSYSAYLEWHPDHKLRIMLSLSLIVYMFDIFPFIDRFLYWIIKSRGSEWCGHDPTRTLAT